MKKHQRGQVLILFALAIIGLFGLVGLAIDGGNAFADRRNAQNAADNAAFAAALKKAGVCGENLSCAQGLWDGAAYNLAAKNGYINGENGDTVTVSWPPEAEFLATLPPGEQPLQYIQVKIHSTFDTYFARVIGIPTMQNNVSAVVRLKETKKNGMYDGASIVSLAPHGDGAFQIDGNANVNLVGGGFLVNSDFNGNCPHGALEIANASSTVITPAITLVEGSEACGLAHLDSPATITTDGDQWNYPVVEYVLPKPKCDTNGYYDAATKTLHPGYYDSFPPKGTGKDVTLISGTYCIEGGLTVNSTDAWQTELNESETDGKGVLFYFLPCTGNECDVTINGNADTFLEAATDPAFTDYPGLLMYFAEDPDCDPVEEGGGCRTVTINGNEGLDLTGTILGPDTYTKINGGGDTFSLSTQIISYDVYISGTANVNIHYDGGDQVELPIAPSIELMK